MMDIGEIIYNRRKELGLTLEQVGEIVGVGKSTVRKWEKGFIQNVKRDKIERLAKALRISPLTFIRGELIPEDYEPQHLSEEDQIRDELFGEYRVLFDLTKKVKPEDIEMVKAFLERITDE